MITGDGRWAVYVHFPYCVHRCNYCDFATVAAKRPPRQATLETTLLELAAVCRDLPRWPIASVFFGGGTPSLWGAPAVGSILAWLDQWSGYTSDVEITLETNPGAVDAAALRSFAEVGVNRISVGVQAMDDVRLRALDRIHDRAAVCATLDAVAELRAVGAVRALSLDLMFGVPGQRVDDLAADLAAIAPWQPDHLSAYALTVEAGTPLARAIARGLAAHPSDADQAEMLTALPALVEPLGMRRYEVSNFAKLGAECRHNLAYWQGAYYLGIGVGAHGFLPGGAHGIGVRTANPRQVDRWRALWQQDLGRHQQREDVTPAAHLDELLLTGLRLEAGLNLRLVAARLGQDAAVALDGACRQRSMTAAIDRVALDAGRVRLLPSAWSMLDGWIASLAVAAERGWRSLDPGK